MRQVFKIAVILLCLAYFELSASAQTRVGIGNNGRPNVSTGLNKTGKKWSLGGNLGFNFLPGGFALDVSPMLGYRFTQRFLGGAGGVFQMTSQTVPLIDPTTGASKNVALNSTAYGGRLFSRYQLIQSIFGHGEFEQLYYRTPNGLNIAGNPIYSKQKSLPSLLVGAGINKKLGAINGNITALYNVLWNKDSYYGQPWVIRGGVGLGF